MPFDLSVLIPARNEMFLELTVENILKNIRGNTEIIVVLDGAWPHYGLKDNPRITIIYHSEAIGQRAATNEAARLSESKFIMKCDAHCAFDEGFDVKLMADCEYDWTIVPRMYNLHAFNWLCKKCGHEVYQGRKPKECGNKSCNNIVDFERKIFWQPKKSPTTDHMRFDKDLKFAYWGGFKSRPEAQADLAPTMSLLGACWFLHRERFWDLDGLDESHGSWGQMGTEIACKSWLSGGQLLCNKKTWFAHMFRTQGGDFGFPYPLSNKAVNRARKYSQDMWKKNKWPKAKYPLDWLIDKFTPVPEWTEEEVPMSVQKTKTKGAIYYTDNRLDGTLIGDTVRRNILKVTKGMDLVSVSLKPIDFGRNFTLDMERGKLTMFKQILKALEESNADIIYFLEHDVLYHPTHFQFFPYGDDAYFYNEHTYKVRAEDGHALFYYCKQTSGLCGYRSLLIEHYRKRVDKVEKDGYSQHMGYEPGCHSPPRGVDNFKAKRWMSRFPNVDIRHDRNLTANRWDRSKFRNKNACLGWRETDNIPGWGVTKGRFEEFLKGV